VLTFNNTFPENDPRRDPHLKKKLIEELPGILNAALNAIAGVIQRGGFTIPQSSVQAAQDWRREADQVSQFVEEACRAEAGFSGTSADLYAAYGRWANDAGIQKRVNRKTFTTRLERLGYRKSRTSGARYIEGLRPVT
jgi:putative DNA primase/helicase